MLSPMATSGAQNDEDDDLYEPLFDYSHIQPSILLDDDDSDGDDIQFVLPGASFGGNEKKRAREETFKEPSTKVDVKEAEEEEDWLPPPPKSIKNVHVSVDGCSMLSALRLQREQLASLTTESAEEMLRKLEESTKKDLQKAANSDSHTAGSEAPEPTVPRKKIVVSVRDDKGSKQFRIYVDEKFEKLFKTYAQHANSQSQNLVFCFDGVKISPNQAPQDLDLEDEDIIDVYSKAG